jgi:capsular polysaccharide biosynthesis protein
LNRRLFLFLGTGVAMIAGVGVAFGRELMDRSVGTPEQAERRLDLPVLASIPETKDK